MSENRKTKRINVTIDELSLSIIDDFAEAIGENRSALIRNLIREAAPQFEKLTKKLRSMDFTEPAQADRLGQVADKLKNNVEKGVELL